MDVLGGGLICLVVWLGLQAVRPIGIAVQPRQWHQKIKSANRVRPVPIYDIPGIRVYVDGGKCLSYSPIPSVTFVSV